MSDQVIIDITPVPAEPVIVNAGQSPVISVNGRYGVVTLTKEDVGLGNISLSAQRWDSVYSTFQNSSASSIVAGGNTRTANITIGTNDAFNLRLETNNTTRINILSSGFIGIGTENDDSIVTQRLTVDGNISATSTIFSAGRRVVTTNTTTVPGTSAVTSILAVSALPVVQETGVLYIVI
jgi:hypothetical protein